MKRVLRCLTAVCLTGALRAAEHQSVTDPAGPQSGRIASLWWFFFAVTCAVFVIVMALALWTLIHRSRGIAQEPLEARHLPSQQTERKLGRVVTGGTIATVVILFVLLIASIGTGKSISELGNKNNGLTVEVTGNQWWWQIRYISSDASQIVTTANEIHIPVGRPVLIRGLSNDVIHSFWIPSLHGKRDLIPSRVTTEWIQADRPGLYRGQCAEFCGLQHAHMILYVVAEAPDKFRNWYRGQLQPASEPSDAVRAHGRQIFANYACVFCHTIRGTSASGQNAPDLTHFGSRLGIAANTLPNTLGNLGGWIVDPQGVKPGNHMATIAVKSDDLQPLLEYLESLK